MMDFAAPERVVELPRDRWGRPLITPPGESEAVAYTRASTLAKMLSDDRLLTDWKTRSVAYGMGLNPLLGHRAATCDPEDRWGKRELQQIAESALKAAVPAATDIGTIVHRHAEAADMGTRPLEEIPDPYRITVQAHRRSLSDLGLEPVSAERFVVLDELRVAGSYDRIYRATRELDLGSHGHLSPGDLILADVKTSKTVDFSALEFAIQTAVYAHGHLYDHTTGRRDAHPEGLVTYAALVIHLPCKTAPDTASIYSVDITRGLSAARTAARVRDIRQWTQRTYAKTHGPLLSHVHTVEVGREAPPLGLRISQATSAGELRSLWASAGSEWTPAHTEAATARLSAIGG